MNDLSPRRPSGTGNYYPLTDHGTDSWSPHGSDQHQNQLRNVPMLQLATWDISSLGRLAQNNCTLIIELSSFIHLLLPQGHRTELTRGVINAIHGRLLSGAWMGTKLCLNFGDTKSRDEAFRKLNQSYLQLGEHRALLDAFPLTPLTNVDIFNQIIADSAMRQLPSGLRRSRSSAVTREHQGPYTWWSTFIHHPHTVQHVIEAVFRYFGDYPRPPFIAGQFGMPNGVVLIHFASEPGFRDINYLTLKGPKLNTGIKLLHDLDIAVCRLQLQAGKGPYNHTEHRCAIKGLDHSGQGVPGNASSPVVVTGGHDHSKRAVTILDPPGTPRQSSTIDVEELIDGSNPIPTQEAASMKPLEASGRISLRGSRVNKVEVLERVAVAGLEGLSHGSIRGVRTSTNVHVSEEMPVEPSDPRTSLGNMVSPLLTNPTTLANSTRSTESIASTRFERPSTTIEARIEKLIDEEREIASENNASAFSTQNDKRNINVQGRSGVRTKRSHLYLAFDEIEAQEPLESINVHRFQHKLKRTQPWETIAARTDQRRGGVTVQVVECYCFFLGHYYIDKSWADKAQAFNSDVKRLEDPRIKRAFEHFTNWITQQEQKGAGFPASFPYYGPLSRQALGREMNLHPGRKIPRPKYGDTLANPTRALGRRSDIIQPREMPRSSTRNDLSENFSSHQIAKEQAKKTAVAIKDTLVSLPPTTELKSVSSSAVRVPRSPSSDSSSSSYSADSWDFPEQTERMTHSPSMQLVRNVEPLVPYSSFGTDTNKDGGSKIEYAQFGRANLLGELQERKRKADKPDPPSMDVVAKVRRLSTSDVKGPSNAMESVRGHTVVQKSGSNANLLDTLENSLRGVWGSWDS